MTNNRVHKRTSVELKIALQEDGDDISINFSVIDISEGGLFVRSNILWEPGQIFFLKFTLPNSDEEIAVKGEVARSEDKYFLFITEDQQDPIPGMGLKFVDLSEHDKEQIKAFISQA
ncbi:PilZ domain-containing protein [bacterium]|nr:PilZ domain-containing protein [bacterium]